MSRVLWVVGFAAAGAGCRSQDTGWGSIVAFVAVFVTLAMTLAIDLGTGGPIHLDVRMSFPIAKVGKLSPGALLPVFYNPQEPADLTVNWGRF